MKIVIPSYNRWDLIITHKYIKNADVIVVIPKSQYDQYKHIEKGNVSIQLIPDSKDGNIAKKRQAILDLYPNDDIVMLDDDIVTFTDLTPWWDIVQIGEKEFIVMILYMIRMMKKFWAYLWWVNWVANKLYMNQWITTKWFLAWDCMVIRQWHGTDFDPNLPCKEDVDFSIQHIVKYSRVVRLNKYAIKKKKYKWKWWVSEQRETTDIERETALYLKKKRANLIKIKPDWESVLLNRKSVWK